MNVQTPAFLTLLLLVLFATIQLLYIRFGLSCKQFEYNPNYIQQHV